MKKAKKVMSSKRRALAEQQREWNSIGKPRRSKGQSWRSGWVAKFRQAKIGRGSGLVESPRRLFYLWQLSGMQEYELHLNPHRSHGMKT
jgi:hypothetical protein